MLTQNLRFWWEGRILTQNLKFWGTGRILTQNLRFWGEGRIHKTLGSGGREGY